MKRPLRSSRPASPHCSRAATFSEMVAGAVSEASSTAVRALIKQFVANESPKKPLSDNQISEMLKEQGIDVVVTSWQGLFAPAKTPEAVIGRLHQEIARVLAQREAVTRLHAGGIEAVASTPAQLTATVNGEIARWGKIIKDIGLRAQ